MVLGLLCLFKVLITFAMVFKVPNSLYSLANYSHFSLAGFLPTFL